LRAVESFPQLLKALHSITFDACLVDNSISEANDSFPIKVKAKSQRAVKRARRAACTSIDATPFQSLGHAVPKTHEQAEELIDRVLIEQKEILKVRAWYRDACHLISYLDRSRSST
jgi:hypothetical protein